MTIAGGAAVGPTQTVIVHKHGRLRSVLVGFLVFLTCLTLIVTGVTIWTHYTVLNTDGYMKLVGPVGKDPQAIKALSGYVAAQVVTASDLQSARAGRPPAKGRVPRRPHHLGRPVVHRKADDQGPEHPSGVQPVAGDQPRQPRADRRPAARPEQLHVHPGQRREAQHAAAREPGAGLARRQAAGRPEHQVLAAGHPARHAGLGLHPAGVVVGRQDAARRTSARSRSSRATRLGRRRRPSSSSTGSSSPCRSSSPCSSR